jgi:hypothetical protein
VSSRPEEGRAPLKLIPGFVPFRNRDLIFDSIFIFFLLQMEVMISHLKSPYWKFYSKLKLKK